jgi:transcriptional regulator with XRE-family HTH domain
MKFAGIKDEQLAAILATNLRRARLKAGLNQRQVATSLDTDAMQISRWERGETSPHAINLARLAAIYDVSMDVLFVLDHPLLPASLDGERAGVPPKPTTPASPEVPRKRETGRRPH